MHTVEDPVWFQKALFLALDGPFLNLKWAFSNLGWALSGLGWPLQACDGPFQAWHGPSKTDKKFFFRFIFSFLVKRALLKK